MAEGFRDQPPALRRQLLVRPRLIAVLHERWDRRLTTIVAGPGLGKTSLMAQARLENALAPRGVDVWITHEVGDRSAELLGQALGAALGVKGADEAGAETMASRLAEAIWQHSPKHVALLLDDVQRIPSGSGGSELLTALLETMPANGHLVTSSRAPLPFPTTRLASLGEVATLGEADLLFDANELREFAAIRGADPDLLAGASGWPALAELIVAVGESAVDRYLWEEIVGRLSDGDRRLLAEIACVGLVDDEIVTALAGRTVRVSDFLAGLPLVADSGDGWCSLHALWEPVLAPDLSNDDRVLACRSAAEVLRGRGDLRRAFSLLAEAGAWDEARSVIRDACLPGAAILPAAVILEWLDRLPSSLANAPEATLMAGVLRKLSEPADAVRLLDEAALGFRAALDHDGELACIAHRAHIAWVTNDWTSLAGLAGRVLALEAEGCPEAEPAAYFVRAFLEASAGEPARALESLDRIPAGSSFSTWAVTHCYRAHVLLSAGDPEKALVAAERAVGLADPSFRPIARVYVAVALWLVGSIEEALSTIRVAVSEAEASGIESYVPFCASHAALMLASNGDALAARDALALAQRAAHTVLSGPGLGRDWPRTAEIMLALAEGDEERATELQRAEAEEFGVATLAGGNARVVIAPLYVMVPEARGHLDARDLGGVHARSRELCRVLVAAREGEIAPLRDMTWPPDHEINALLPSPWAAELAVAGIAAGRPEANALLESLGPTARPVVRRLAGSRAAQVAKAARKLLARMPHEPVHRVRVHVLGPAGLWRDGVPVADRDWERRERVRSLLLYLVSHEARSRREVSAALWPDLDESSSDHNLRVTLSYLLRVLEPERKPGDSSFFIGQERGLLRLQGEGWLEVDAWEFESVLDDAEAAELQGVPSRALERYRQAVELYRGDYLADAAYAEWALLERDRFRSRFVRAAVRAGELLLGQRAPDEALKLALRAVDAEPWSEHAHRLMAASYLDLGDRGAARRSLDRCDAMLAELDVQPDPETQALRRAVVSGGRLTPG